MSEVCKEWSAKRGRISTKSMPGIGKSANCRRAARRLIFVRASSAALAAEEVGWDWRLGALSVVAEVLLGRATGVCCVVIVEREERRREESFEVRFVIRYAKDKNFWDGVGGSGPEGGCLWFRLANHTNCQQVSSWAWGGREAGERDWKSRPGRERWCFSTW